MKKIMILSMLYALSMSANVVPNIADHAEKNDWAMVSVLAEKPETDLNARNHDGATALMLASDKGNIAIVQQLVSRGASLDAQDCFGQTAFKYALGSIMMTVAEGFEGHQASIGAKVSAAEANRANIMSLRFFNSVRFEINNLVEVAIYLVKSIANRDDLSKNDLAENGVDSIENDIIKSWLLYCASSNMSNIRVPSFIHSKLLDLLEATSFGYKNDFLGNNAFATLQMLHPNAKDDFR